MSSTALEPCRRDGRLNVSTKRGERNMLHFLPSPTWAWWPRWRQRERVQKKREATESSPPPLLLPLRTKSGAIKCKTEEQTAPPRLVGEFVLKWKWGWWRTWRLAPRLTWKERKRQLLIFSFDLWLPLVFHTNADLWSSLTARCRITVRGRVRGGGLTSRTRNISVHSFHLFVSISVLFTSYVLLLSAVSLCVFLCLSALVEFQLHRYF